MVTEQELKAAYEMVLQETDNTLTSGLFFEEAKEKLETLILKATADGRIVGSNDSARKAAGLVLFEKEYLDKDNKEKAYRLRSNTLALVKIRLDCLRDLIRIEELAKK